MLFPTSIRCSVSFIVPDLSGWPVISDFKKFSMRPRSPSDSSLKSPPRGPSPFPPSLLSAGSQAVLGLRSSSGVLASPSGGAASALVSELVVPPSNGYRLEGSSSKPYVPRAKFTNTPKAFNESMPKIHGSANVGSEHALITHLLSRKFIRTSTSPRTLVSCPVAVVARQPPAGRNENPKRLTRLMASGPKKTYDSTPRPPRHGHHVPQY